MDWSDVFSKILVGALSGLVVAFFTARYALNRFYQEKWWDKRLDFFVQLVDSLYALKKAEGYWFSRQRNSEIGYDEGWRSLSDADEALLQQSYDVEMESLRKIGDLSPLLLNKECQRLINSYLEKQASLISQFDNDEIETLDAHQASYEGTVTLFEEIIGEARRELKSEHLDLCEKTTRLIDKIKQLITKKN